MAWARSRLIVGCVVAAAALGGCTAETEATKAGQGVAPRTLRVATDDPAGRPSGEQIEEFARQVDALSEGRLRIEPAWRAAGDTAGDDWDQKVARLVVSGELEMGLIPSRAWDTEGVTSLRALNAPFLLTTNEATAEVVTSDLAETMLSGLDEAGVRGLALWPEGMRRVFSFGEPLLAPEQFEGLRIRVPASATAYAAFEALGAVPDDASNDDAAMHAGEVAAAESSFALAPTLVGTTVALGNLALYPKVNSLAVNAGVWDELLPQDLQDVLVDAAVRTTDWAVESLPDEAEAARKYCASGGTVVLAEPADVAALRAATRPMLDDLARDESTAEVLEAIEELVGTQGASAPIDPCGDPSDDAAAPEPPSGVDETFPIGTYRAEITADVLRSYGLTPEEVDNHVGVWTLTFDEDGHFRGGGDQGVYCASADRLSLGLDVFTPPGGTTTCDSFWSARWSLVDSALVFSDIELAEGRDSPDVVEAVFGSTPFRRTG